MFIMLIWPFNLFYNSIMYFIVIFYCLSHPKIITLVRYCYVKLEHIEY